MSKIILGEFTMSMIVGRNPGTGFQYMVGLEYIKEHGELTEDDVKRLSSEYAIPPAMLTEPVRLVEDFLDVSFAGDKLRLRYTDYTRDRNDFFRTVFPEIDERIKRQTEKLNKRWIKTGYKLHKLLLSILSKFRK
jgi:hypothetical protein